MSEHESQDWLSAWLDGETAPSERGSAERRIESDPVAQSDLEQFGEIGNLLRSLPRSDLPAGFPAVVMQRCERESLFAGEGSPAGHVAAARSAALDACAAAHPSGAAAAPKRTRSKVVIVAGILATAAMLFLLVQVVGPPGNPMRENRDRPGPAQDDKLAQNENGNDKTLAARGGREKSAEQLRAPVGGPAISAGANPAVAATKATKSDPAKSARSVAPLVTRSFSAPKAAIARNAVEKRSAGAFPVRRGNGARFGAAGGSEPTRFDFGNRQSGFRIGEVIPYLHVSGDRTAVIEVTVVDVNQAVGRLEVLLEKKLVMPLTRTPKRQRFAGKSAAEGKLLSLKGAGDNRSKSELVAVYVESTQAQLAQVMRELDKETKSLHISLRPPVALGDVRLQADSDTWADLFRRDRRRPPRTLADAAEFGRQTVVTKSAQKDKEDEIRAARSATRANPPAAGVAKDAVTKAKRRVKAATPSLEKKDGDVADKQKIAAARADRKKSTAAAVKPDAGDAAGSRSFQLRLKLSSQPATPRDERDSKGRSAESGKRRAPARSSLGPAAGTGPDAARGAATSRPVQVIFVFRPKPAADRPVPARRP